MINYEHNRKFHYEKGIDISIKMIEQDCGIAYIYGKCNIYGKEFLYRHPVKFVFDGKLTKKDIDSAFNDVYSEFVNWLESSTAKEFCKSGVNDGSNTKLQEAIERYKEYKDDPFLILGVH